MDNVESKLMPNDVERYYKRVVPLAKAQLQNLRHTIKKELKGSEEVISYQIPTFRYKGKLIVAIGAFKDHISLFPLSSKTIKKFSSELKDYKKSKGTMQFSFSDELPIMLIKEIIDQRLKELSLN